MAASITGIKELDVAMRNLATNEIKKAARQAINKGIRVLAKSQKSKVPPRYKHLKKLIGSRFGKAKAGSQRGQVQAKAGFGVGKKRTRLDKETGKRVASKLTESRKLKDGEKRRGVGISLNNIHWIVLGTKERRHKKSGHKTGKMPPILERIIPEGTEAGTSEAVRVITDSLRTSIAKAGKS